jgi:hypothetical protein
MIVGVLLDSVVGLGVQVGGSGNGVTVVTWLVMVVGSRLLHAGTFTTKNRKVITSFIVVDMFCLAFTLTTLTIHADDYFLCLPFSKPPNGSR